MSDPKVEKKVGWFVFFCLVLLAVLLISFTKGVTAFSRNYNVTLTTADVGGIKRGASVLMSGYPIGNVTVITLASNGNSVTLNLSIKRGHLIPADSRFNIEQSGFLGDQFVAVKPGTNENAGYLSMDGDAQVAGTPPFNLLDTARDAGGFIKNIDHTAKMLNDAIADVRRMVLNQQTLTNLADTIHNLRDTSLRAVAAVEELRSLISTNSPALSDSVSNFQAFTKRLDAVAASLNDIVSTNSDAVSRSLKNVEDSTVSLKAVMADVQAGNGAVGKLLKDPEVAADVAAIADNLSVTSSNLNRLGLWGIMWSKKPAQPAKTNPPARK